MNGNGRQMHGGLTDESVQRLTRALGWFSLGVGLAALAAPHRIAHVVGLTHDAGNLAMLRAVGLREIASGVGILTQSNPSSWLWARVGGDAMDLAMLTRAMGNENADRGKVATATVAVLGVTAIDALASMQMSQDQGVSSPEAAAPTHEPRVASTITVNAPIAEVYAAWQGFRRLPDFMESFATVTVTDDRLSLWQLSLPGGLSVSWDATITSSVSNERISWRSGDASNVNGSGHVHFRPAPAEQGTEVLFDAKFSPPGGELGSKIAGLFTDPLGVKLNNDLRRFKQLLELGEIVKSDDTMVKGPNPAQPVGMTKPG